MESQEPAFNGNSIRIPPYSCEIFSLLKDGAFLCKETFDSDHRKYFDTLESNQEDFALLFLRLGYRLNGCPGYFYLSEENKPLVNKKTQGERDRRRFIPFENLMSSYPSILGAGDTIRKSDFLKHCEDLPDAASHLSAYCSGAEKAATLSAKVEAFLRAAAADGFLEVNNRTNMIIITSAYDYLKGFIDRIVTFGEYAVPASVAETAPIGEYDEDSVETAPAEPSLFNE